MTGNLGGERQLLGKERTVGEPTNQHILQKRLGEIYRWENVQSVQGNRSTRKPMRREPEMRTWFPTHRDEKTW